MASGGVEEKTWGKRPFWGVSFDYDPQWLLDDEQKKIQRQLIELCRTTLRHNAVVSDDTYEYPRKNMNALASIGMLGLIVPKEMGGLGQSHMFAALVTETIARYGCPSTAMVYVMHTGAVACLLFRYHNNPRLRELLERIDKDCMIGTLAYSDPATGGHFWYPLSSRAKVQNGCVQLLKYGSWATSAGFADFYVVQTTSPDFKGDYSNLSCFLLFKDEVRANTEDWISLGMHGNQSGPLVCEGMFTEDRCVGPFGDGAMSNDECVDPYFLLCSSACWNGISLGCIDLAKKHVTTKQHADVGMRVADYPTIQDYFGEAICDTNSCRMLVYSVAQAMDKTTNSNDWSIHSDLTVAPRAELLHWGWQLKFSAAKNVTHVADKMMHACGGTGFKKELGLERLLRDGKASWVMGPSNEVLRQFVGKSALFGLPILDFWVQRSNPRALNAELKKLTDQEKVALAEKLMRDVSMNDPNNKSKNHPYQDSEFDNPFNTRPPAVREPYTSPDGVAHKAALGPDHFVALKLVSVKDMGEKQAEYQFSLPDPTDHTGCLSGQYVQVKVTLAGSDGKSCRRYFSPVSGTHEYGSLTLVMKYESQGLLSQQFKKLKPGDSVEVKGPCGGFEYSPNTIQHLSLLASGGGATPCIQLVRDIMADPSDQTSVRMIYYADKESEFLYRSELDAYAAKDAKRFGLLYTMKDGLEFDEWSGGDGYIDGEKMASMLPPPDSTESHKVLVCGGPSMIITVLQYLFEMGYSSEDIFVYGQFGVEQLRSIFGRNAKLSAHRVEPGDATEA